MSSDARIEISSVGNVTAVTLPDTSIIDPMRVEELRTTLGQLVEPPNNPSLILDMTTVEHLSSSALGFLITLNNQSRQHDGKLVLTGLCDGIVKLLTITKLTGFLNIAECMDDAVGMIQPNPKM